MINGDENQSDGGVTHGTELMTFAEALASRDEGTLAVARERLMKAGSPNLLVEAAAVAGNFQRMVRIADATGIPIDSMSVAIGGNIRRELNLERFSSAANTPQSGLLSRLVAPIKGKVIRSIVIRMGRKKLFAKN
jgi:hypothetical protein